MHPKTMQCAKCQSENSVKNGIINERQRYKCKVCGNNYTFDYSYFAEKEKKRRFGLSMYLEGLGFHSIGRLLNDGIIRHVLARFRRKTKCYSKSEQMINYSLKLLMAKRNNEISIQTY